VSKTPLNRPIAAYMSACALATAWASGSPTSGRSGAFYLLKYLSTSSSIHRGQQHPRPSSGSALVIIALRSGHRVIVRDRGRSRAERVSARLRASPARPEHVGGYLV